MSDYQNDEDLPLFRQLPTRDPNVDPIDEPRLRGQNKTILELLRKRTATNVELAQISLKYTSRISDLRAVGYLINCTRKTDEGVTVYELAGWKKP